MAAVIGLNTLVQAHALGPGRRSAHAQGAHRRGGDIGELRAPGRVAHAVRGRPQRRDQERRAHRRRRSPTPTGPSGSTGQGDFGAGQRVAIYEHEPFLHSDIQTFDTCYFGASSAAAMIKRLNVIPVDGGQPTGPGSGEANLDVEDVSAVAPGAAIDVYEGPFNGDNADVYDSLDEYAAIIDADRDQVISTSWGLCEQVAQQGQPGLQQAENLLFEQAAAQGQTVFSPAGDNGSDDCNTFETPTVASGQNPVSVDDPSSQPYVVSVGGTTIDRRVDPAAGEQVWNDGTQWRRRRRRHLGVVDDAGLAAGGDGAGRPVPRGARLRQRQQRRAAVRLPAELLPEHGRRRERDDAVPARARRVSPGRRVHRGGDRLQRGQRRQRLGDRRRDVVVGAAVGGHAGAGQRVGDLQPPTRRPRTAWASSARCCTRWRRSPPSTRRRSATSPPATTTSTASTTAWCSRPPRATT